MKKMIFLLTTLLVVSNVFAQTENYLLYKEYDPDFWVIVTQGHHYDIDINDDSIPDVRYKVFTDKTGSYVLTMNGWKACSYCLNSYGSSNSFFYDLSIPLNDTSLVWDGMCHFEALVQNPSITPLVYKVALRYRDGEDFYYGWAEFEELRETYYNRGKFHVAQTCYCAIPNYPLHWGQTSLTEGLEETEATAFVAVYPNPAKDIVTITGKDLKQAEVFNTLSQRVSMVQGQGETLQIDIVNLPAGVYFVNITDEEGRKCVRKVVKE